MNASQPSLESLQPEKPTRKRPRTKRNPRKRTHQILALEVTAKIAVNLTISIASVSALCKLLPYYWVQQDKLREVRTEVKVMEGRVETLQQEFSRNFDPKQSKTIMQQQLYRFDANQRPIIIINQEPNVPEKLDSTP